MQNAKFQVWLFQQTERFPLGFETKRFQNRMVEIHRSINVLCYVPALRLALQWHLSTWTGFEEPGCCGSMWGNLGGQQPPGTSVMLCCNPCSAINEFTIFFDMYCEECCKPGEKSITSRIYSGVNSEKCFQIYITDSYLNLAELCARHCSEYLAYRKNVLYHRAVCSCHKKYLYNTA